MKRYAPFIFIIIGAADLIYGITTGDGISLGIGTIMIGLSLYVLYKDRLSTKDEEK